MSKKEIGHTDTSSMDQVLYMLETGWPFEGYKDQEGSLPVIQFMRSTLGHLLVMQAINSAIRVTPEQFDAIKTEGHGEVIWRSDTKYRIGQHHIVSDSAVDDGGRRDMIVIITEVKNHNNCPKVIPYGFKKISFDYFNPKSGKSKCV